MRTAIDTNVLSAVLSREPLAQHAAERLGIARQEGGLVIAAPVYAELRANPRATTEFVDRFLEATNVVIDYGMDAALWRVVADRFSAYATRRRESGGTAPKRLLVDFLIGAHALQHADQLMTLDAKRYQTDFPELSLITF